jgi:hypothetical protein
MDHIASHNWKAFALAGALVGLLAWPGTSEAQTVTGQASAVTATVLGMTTSLANTGTLSGTSDARDADLLTGSVPSLLTGEALGAATIGYPDEVDSEASLTSLNMTVAGYGISADSVMARAFAVLGGSSTGLTNIDGLSIGGVPVFPTGDPNQTISLGVLSVVLNEQIPSAGGMIVNALHVTTIDGLTDVVIGSANAGITSSTGSTGLPSLF